MPRAKKKTDQNDDYKAKMITVEYNPQQIEALKHYATKTEVDTHALLDDLTQSGWKVSVSYSEYYSCYVGSLTSKFFGTNFDGFTYLFYHDDLVKLMYEFEFFFKVMLEDMDTPKSAGTKKGSW